MPRCAAPRGCGGGRKRDSSCVRWTTCWSVGTCLVYDHRTTSLATPLCAYLILSLAAPRWFARSVFPFFSEKKNRIFSDLTFFSSKENGPNTENRRSDGRVVHVIPIVFLYSAIDGRIVTSRQRKRFRFLPSRSFPSPGGVVLARIKTTRSIVVVVVITV